ncbi:MAG: signal peptidase II [Solirubrobacteraceae bacterium]
MSSGAEPVPAAPERTGFQGGDTSAPAGSPGETRVVRSARPTQPEPGPGPEPSLRRRRSIAFARAFAVMAAVILVDRLTKHAVVSGIAVGDVHKFLPGVQLVHVRNSGVAFGFFAGGGVLVLLLTFVALAALIVYFLMRPTRSGLWLPTGLLVGGALGNLIDRLLNGSVTDFIKLPLWPAFNVSDMAITFGVLALLYVLEGPSSAPSSGG